MILNSGNNRRDATNVQTNRDNKCWQESFLQRKETYFHDTQLFFNDTTTNYKVRSFYNYTSYFARIAIHGPCKCYVTYTKIVQCTNNCCHSVN